MPKVLVLSIDPHNGLIRKLDKDNYDRFQEGCDSFDSLKPQQVLDKFSYLDLNSFNKWRKILKEENKELLRFIKKISTQLMPDGTLQAAYNHIFICCGSQAQSPLSALYAATPQTQPRSHLFLGINYEALREVHAEIKTALSYWYPGSNIELDLTSFYDFFHQKPLGSTFKSLLSSLYELDKHPELVKDLCPQDSSTISWHYLLMHHYAKQTKEVLKIQDAEIDFYVISDSFNENTHPKFIDTSLGALNSYYQRFNEQLPSQLTLITTPYMQGNILHNKMNRIISYSGKIDTNYYQTATQMMLQSMPENTTALEHNDICNCLELVHQVRPVAPPRPLIRDKNVASLEKFTPPSSRKGSRISQNVANPSTLDEKKSKSPSFLQRHGRFLLAGNTAALFTGLLTFVAIGFIKPVLLTNISHFFAAAFAIAGGLPVPIFLGCLALSILGMGIGGFVSWLQTPSTKPAANKEPGASLSSTATVAQISARAGATSPLAIAKPNAPSNVAQSAPSAPICIHNKLTTPAEPLSGDEQSEVLITRSAPQ